MRSIEPKLLALCSAALLVALARPALATGAEEDAKTLFAQGRELRKGGKCAEAIVAFRRALDVYPEGLGALRNVAECEEDLGLYASARRDWWDLRRAALRSNEAKYAGWDSDAEAHYRALEGKVARMTIQLRGDDLKDVRVAVDGKPLDPRLIGMELERDLGAHTVEAFYGGASPVSQRVELSAGERKTITLIIPSQPTAAQQRLPGDGAPRPPPDRFDGLRTGGFIALGVGGAGAAATIIAIVVRAGALSSIEKACPRYETQPCSRDIEDDHDTGQTASTLANVFGGVAIAGLGAGAALIAISSSSATPGPHPTGNRSNPSAQLFISPTHGGAAAQLEVRF